LEQTLLRGVLQLNLNPAISKFAEDARLQWRRRIYILQAIDSKADSVKSLIPQGKENEKNHFTLSVNELAFCFLHNTLI